MVNPDTQNLQSPCPRLMSWAALLLLRKWTGKEAAVPSSMIITSGTGYRLLALCPVLRWAVSWLSAPCLHRNGFSSLQ